MRALLRSAMPHCCLAGSHCIWCSMHASVWVQAATRGDGLVGEDVTHNVAAISGLPRTLPRTPAGSPHRGAPFTVRGEVFISLADFEELNRERMASGEEPFASARNAAAGSLRLPDPQRAAGRRLRFVAFELLHGQGLPQRPEEGACAAGLVVARHTEAMEELGRLGFDTLAACTRVEHGLEAAIHAAEQMMATRADLPFQADGFVIKLNCLAVRTRGAHSRAGITAGKHARLPSPGATGSCAGAWGGGTSSSLAGRATCSCCLHVALLEDGRAGEDVR